MTGPDRRSATFAALAMLAAAVASPAGAAGDPVAGEALAREHCARCHDVGADGPAKGHPPAFAAIARYRPEEQIRRRVMFPDVHSGMPDVAFSTLDPAGFEDIVAYILSLER